MNKKNKQEETIMFMDASGMDERQQNTIGSLLVDKS